MGNENTLGFTELFKSDLPKISPRKNPVGHKYSSASKVLNYQRLLCTKTRLGEKLRLLSQTGERLSLLPKKLGFDMLGTMG